MMTRRIFAILAVLAWIGVSSLRAEHPLNIPGADNTKVGIYIEDLKSGEVLADINADDFFIPASVMKSVTSATALSTFVPDGCFTTLVSAVGSIDDGVLDGDVVVNTIGDPTIESSHFKDYQGFADSIAVNLRRLGVDSVAGRVVIDESRFVDATVPEGWASGDLSSYYGTLVHGANYRGNASGKAAVKNPASVMNREIRQALTKVGIKIGDNDVDADDEQETDVYLHSSPALYDILHSLMIRSDNMFAEAILRSMAMGETRRAALDYEIEMWRDRGLDMSEVKILDGSGLSRADRLSPRWVAGLYKWMYGSAMRRQYSDLFPRAGREGTMRSFLKDTPLEGRVAMKTGSMSGVQGYGGYMLDKKGNPSHVIVIFVNDFTCDRSRLRSALADFLVKTLPCS